MKKGRKHVNSTLTQKNIFYFSVSAFLFSFKESTFLERAPGGSHPSGGSHPAGRASVSKKKRKKEELVFSTLTHHNKLSALAFSIQFLFERVDLPGARTGGLPPIGGSPPRGARIIQKKISRRALALEVVHFF